MVLRRFAGCLTLMAGIAAGQPTVSPRKQPAPAAEGAPHTAVLRADTNLVLVPTSVSDPLSRPVTGLEKENFRVFDDGVEQTITHFAMEDEPIAVGLVYDVSGSMGNRLGHSRIAAQKFFQTANRDDECFL